MKIKIIATISALILISSYYTQAQELTYYTRINDRDMSESMMRTVEFLSSDVCEGRESGSRGSFESISYIASLFESIGLEPLFGNRYVQGFGYTVADTARYGRNIGGIIHGKAHEKYRQPYIIICAHYDHLGKINGKMYPGADDNASGIAAMRYVAERYTIRQEYGDTTGRSIIFLAFDAKEYSMAGSRAFIEKLVSERGITDRATGKKIRKEDIFMTLNLDQIGTVLEPFDENREYMIILGSEKMDDQTVKMMKITNKYLVPSLSVSYSYYGSSHFSEIFLELSDQVNFNRVGIPGLLLTSGINSHTYKTSDTPAIIDSASLLSRSKFIYLFTERISRGY